MKRRKSRKNYLLPIILITLLITIGYSAVQTQLSINGNISASSSIYNISWNNIQTTEGSITPTTSPTITNNKTEVNYSLNFTNPGDFYEFSFDSVNNGSNDAMIKSITSIINDQDISNLPSILEYTATYSDGTEIGLKDYLKKGNDSKETITIKVKVKDNATNTQISNLSQPLNFKFIIDYVKADSTAKKVVHGVHCTYEGEMTQGAEYINGDYRYRYKQEVGDNGWTNITDDGWGVRMLNTEIDAPVTSPICTTINGKPIVSMRKMFANTTPTSIDFSTYVTTNVKDMSYMFSNNETPELDLSTFDTANVEDMSYMFESCYADIIDLSSFNTSKVTNMDHMFYDTGAEELNISNFNTPKVTNMSHMFELSYVRNLDFTNIDTSKVTNMTFMFANTENITTLDLSSFNTSSVTNMDSMFYFCNAETINTSTFNTSNVTDMRSMFAATNQATINLSNFNTSKVTRMDSMFFSTHATNINMLSFNTSNVTDMNSMFYNYTGTTLDISSFNTSKVTNMSSMFYNNTNLTNIYVGSGWSVSNVSNNNSTNMFYNDTKLPHFSSRYVDKTRATTNSWTGYLTLKS